MLPGKVLAGWRALGAFAAVVVWGAGPELWAQESPPTSLPEILTNLFQLRQSAEQKPAIGHPFRVVAEVCDADWANGAVALRDGSGVEFVHVAVSNRAIEPGATVCLEGKGCGLRLRGFGIAVVPGMAVENDGLHPVKEESGTVSLHAGRNPIRLDWFNGPGEAALVVEYEGPGLPRQRVPGSVLWRGLVEARKGITNYEPGLEYRSYEGSWLMLPDFAKDHAVSTGVATNFDLGVRTRAEDAGLDFSGFIELPRDGAYTFHLTSDDGSCLWVGEPSVEVCRLSHGTATAAAMPAGAPGSERPAWLTLEGPVSFVGLRGTGAELQLRMGNDLIRVDVFESGKPLPELPPRTRVRVSGLYRDIIHEDGTRAPGLLQVCSWASVHAAGSSESEPRAPGARDWTKVRPEELPAASETPLPLTTAAEIKALPPEVARQQRPVSVRGVVTAWVPEFHGAVIQDSTRGIFVYLDKAERGDLPLELGEYYQIEGVTGPGMFAPVIEAHRIKHLGSGQWPQPLRATWTRLVNGSLDTQYVEIDGVVTAVEDRHLTLRTEGGKITLNLNDFRPEVVAAYAGAVVRVRGCVFAPFNERTRELEGGELRMGDAVVSVLQPAPCDLFAVPPKSIGELRLYDPEAAPFRLEKVSGQIIDEQPGEYLLTDGTNGVRVTAPRAGDFALGDVVEAVGFLGLGGAAAELKEAVLRKIGHGPLPPAIRLSADELLQGRFADTRVRVQATLMNRWREGAEDVLDLQSRFLLFRARVENHGRAVELPVTGSRLELTGVYVPLGSRANDGTVSGFELRLPSVGDLRVLGTPPWWNLKHGLALSGVLAALLCAALVWNKVLQRQVLERGQLLETEVHNRERAEQQRAAEAERARIARDLHDELGTGLTEVSLLASAGISEVQGAGKGPDRFRTIAEKARALVSALDVIVWAIDPKRNSLQSFADYLGSYAEELLGASNIGCRLRIPIECGAVALSGAARHSLFLAIKEALNNVIRHAAATEVELQMSQQDHRLEIVIVDNGRGFEWNSLRRRNGLLNLEERLRALEGECEIDSQAGRGTRVTFVVPLGREAGTGGDT